MAAYDSNNEEIHFTPTEFAMLTYLMKNAARAVPRSELLPTVWGFENDSGTRVADDTVKRLRKKLQNTNLSIETIWGYGFKVREKQRDLTRLAGEGAPDKPGIFIRVFIVHRKERVS